MFPISFFTLNQMITIRLLDVKRQKPISMYLFYVFSAIIISIIVKHLLLNKFSYTLFHLYSLKYV